MRKTVTTIAVGCSILLSLCACGNTLGGGMGS
ncbi:hypothetical protein EV128_10528 [Rhizobium azibense]|nr:hypothetical protein EV128_10528 [Rhizobium azibense]